MAWVAIGLAVAAVDAMLRELRPHHVLLVAVIAASEGALTTALERSLLPRTSPISVLAVRAAIGPQGFFNHALAMWFRAIHFTVTAAIS